jgi:hypothetical protein
MSGPRVLVVGGAGVFGSRLAQGLVQATSAHIILAGRDFARAQAAKEKSGAHEAVALDRRTATPESIRQLSPRLVIDAAGPFQGADLSFARASVAAGADYLDLCDARDFVAAFPGLDAEAKAKGVRAFTGASSTPALTHAALDTLTASWRRIDRLRIGISPANQTPRGRAVIEAVLTWAGAPVRVFEGGQWRERPGWSGGFSHPLPGLGPRRFRLAETPDLDLLVSRYHPTDEALMSFGLQLDIMHFGLAVLASLRRLSVNIRPLAPVLHALSDMLLPFGSDAGGMFVEAWGRDASDRPVRAEWSLTIGEKKGLYVPTLPALAMARRLISGEALPPGAAPCVGILRLSDMHADFDRHGMITRSTVTPLTGPFEMALGPAFEALPEIVKASHRTGPVTHLNGTAKVEGASGLAILPAALFGLPRPADAAAVHVEKRTIAPGREIWKRNIGGARFKSDIRHKAPGLVTERFGPFTFDLELTASPEAHIMRIAGWRIGPIPLPRFLAPKSLASEMQAASGRFAFDVPISAPLLGRLTRYRGDLAVAEAAAERETIARTAP